METFYPPREDRDEGRLRRMGRGLLRGVMSIGGGMANLLDIGGDPVRRPYRPRSYEEAMAADSKAIRGDWESVGDDIEAAMNKYHNYRNQ